MLEPAAPESSAPSQSNVPDRPQFSGAVGAIVTYVAVLMAARDGLVLPEYVQAAIPAVVYGLIAYVVPPTARQIAMRMNDRIVRLAAAMPETLVSERTVVLPSAASPVKST